MSARPIALVGALYAGSERGLTAEMAIARALGFDPLPVCTSLVMASGGVVTDVTEVPSDSVIAQFKHTAAAFDLAGVHVSVLADHHTVEGILDAVASVAAPVVLDFVASGPSGETVLTSRGIDAVAERLGAADLVTISKRDAELVTRAQIDSLDDAQVAAQRIHNRGAKAVVIRCGALPHRFYDAADDPGGDGAASPLFADLLFDGTDFALFEAPLLPEPTPESSAAAFSVPALAALVAGEPLQEALQIAKRFATESVRHATEGGDGSPRLNPRWLELA